MEGNGSLIDQRSDTANPFAAKPLNGLKKSAVKGFTDASFSVFRMNSDKMDIRILRKCLRNESNYKSDQNVSIFRNEASLTEVNGPLPDDLKRRPGIRPLNTFSTCGSTKPATYLKRQMNLL